MPHTKFEPNRVENEVLPILTPLAPFFRQNGVKKWENCRFDPSGLHQWPQGSSGANFIKVGSKLPKPLNQVSPDSGLVLPFKIYPKNCSKCSSEKDFFLPFQFFSFYFWENLNFWQISEQMSSVWPVCTVMCLTNYASIFPRPRHYPFHISFGYK